MRKIDIDTIFSKEKYRLIINELQNVHSGLTLNQLYTALHKKFNSRKRVLDYLSTLKREGLITKNRKCYCLIDKVPELVTLQRNISLLTDCKNEVKHTLETWRYQGESIPNILTYSSPSQMTQAYLHGEQFIPEKYHCRINELFCQMETCFKELDTLFMSYERELFQEHFEKIKKKRWRQKGWKNIATEMARYGLIDKPDVRLISEYEIKHEKELLEKYQKSNLRNLTVVINSTMTSSQNESI